MASNELHRRTFLAPGVCCFLLDCAFGRLLSFYWFCHLAFVDRHIAYNCRSIQVSWSLSSVVTHVLCLSGLRIRCPCVTSRFDSILWLICAPSVNCRPFCFCNALRCLHSIPGFLKYYYIGNHQHYIEHCFGTTGMWYSVLCKSVRTLMPWHSC